MLAAGCSSSDGTNSGSRPPGTGSSAAGASIAPGVQVRQLQATDALRFSPPAVTVKSGRVRLTFTVTGKLPETFTSRALQVDTGNVPAGHSITIELIVPHPGRYIFYSAYHKAQGMTGTIVAEG
jgi:plastocyanin